MKALVGPSRGLLRDCTTGCGTDGALTALLKEKLSRLEEEKKMLETENLELRHLLDHSDDEDIPDSGFRSQQVR